MVSARQTARDRQPRADLDLVPGMHALHTTHGALGLSAFAHTDTTFFYQLTISGAPLSSPRCRMCLSVSPTYSVRERTELVHALR